MARLSSGARSLLAAARDVLESHDWCQGSEATNPVGASVSPFSADASAFCLNGALRPAAEERRTFRDAISEARNRLAEWCEVHAAIRLPEGFRISAFNDGVATSKQDVIALLTAAVEEDDDTHA